jgi:hypothetical protein
MNNMCKCKANYWGGHLTTCTHCGKGCLSCLDASACACDYTDNWVQKDSHCECPEGNTEYPIGDPKATCTNCIPGCTLCSNTESCTTCGLPGWTSDSNSVCICDVGFWYTSDPAPACTACNKTCKECGDSGLQECTVCKDNSSLNIINSATGRGECIADNGFYLDSSGDSKPCHYSCLTCNGAGWNQCERCHVTATMFQNSCICPRLNYMKATICQKDTAVVDDIVEESLLYGPNVISQDFAKYRSFGG